MLLVVRGIQLERKERRPVAIMPHALTRQHFPQHEAHRINVGWSVRVMPLQQHLWSVIKKRSCVVCAAVAGRSDFRQTKVRNFGNFFVLVQQYVSGFQVGVDDGAGAVGVQRVQAGALSIQRWRSLLEVPRAVAGDDAMQLQSQGQEVDRGKKAGAAFQYRIYPLPARC